MDTYCIMSSYKIIGDKIIFENPYHDDDIVLQHKHNELQLIFNSKVKFKQTTTHQTVQIGSFEVIENTDGNLEFRKNGKIKFIVE